MEGEKRIEDALRERNEWLRERLAAARKENDNLREEVRRWKNIAEDERTAWIRTHDAMNVLREDVMRVLREHNADSVYRELEDEREAHQKLKDKRKRWMQFARQSVEMKSLMSQKVRDLELVLQEMRERLTEIEQQRDTVKQTASDLIQRRDDQLERIRVRSTFWHKGIVGALEAIAGIHAEFGGSPLPSVSDMDRQRAVRDAQTLSLLNEATNLLVMIEVTLDEAGVSPEGTHADRVRRLAERTAVYKEN